MTTEHLIAYVLGELSQAEADALAAAVRTDPAARAQLDHVRASLETLRAAGREAELWKVPPDSRARLLRLCPAAPSSWLADLRDRTREVLAGLLFDGRSAAAAAGMRGSTREQHVIYGVDDVEIDLRLTPETTPIDPQRVRKYRVYGQIAGAADANSVVLRGFDAGDAVSSAVDADGVFALDAAPGEYELTISTAERVFVVPFVQLADRLT